MRNGITLSLCRADAFELTSPLRATPWQAIASHSEARRVKSGIIDHQKDRQAPPVGDDFISASCGFSLDCKNTDEFIDFSAQSFILVIKSARVMGFYLTSASYASHISCSSFKCVALIPFALH